MQKPKKLSLVVIYGPAGAGKTTLADLLHDELAFTAHIGADHIKRFISEFREVPSHQEVSKRVVGVMAAEYLRQGINVIVEQGMSADEIGAFETIADQNEAHFLVYRLDAPRPVLDNRVTERAEQLQKPTVPKETIDALYKTHEETSYSNNAAFDSESLSPREMADRILKDLGV
jgi:predicted kinase